MATIQLDTTLADLYREHGIKGKFVVTTHCVFGHMDLHPEFPRELVYPEDEEPVPYSENEQEKARLRMIILGFKPLRRIFGVGDMDVIVFAPNVCPDQVGRNLSQLPPNQRYRLRIIDLDEGNVLEQLREIVRGRTLIFWRPQAWMREHNCLVDPQLAYDINSKDYLTKAGIRTPFSKVVSLEDIGDESVFATHELPFAVKLLRSGGGRGTYLVTSPDRRREMLVALATCKKRGSTAVILSEYIASKLELSVHFFIGAPESDRNRNNPLILGISIPTFTDKGKWVGGYIDYRVQTDLQNLVWDTVVDTARRLPREFTGWAGVDILVDAKGEQWVVDLNARFTGSMTICFMSGHFWRERGLPVAQFTAFEYPGEMNSIYGLFSPMLESGQLIVTATANIETQSNMADIVWGAKDEDDLAQVGNFIKETLRPSGSAVRLI